MLQCSEMIFTIGKYISFAGKQFKVPIADGLEDDDDDDVDRVLVRGRLPRHAGVHSAQDGV